MARHNMQFSADADLAKEIDAFADAHGFKNTASAVRYLTRIGLDAERGRDPDVTRYAIEVAVTQASSIIREEMSRMVASVMSRLANR